jgi:hypothetical protein
LEVFHGGLRRIPTGIIDKKKILNCKILVLGHQNLGLDQDLMNLDL